jgi:hypothetical protein
LKVDDTPKAIIDRYNSTFNEILAQPNVRAKASHPLQFDLYESSDVLRRWLSVPKTRAQ